MRAWYNPLNWFKEYEPIESHEELAREQRMSNLEDRIGKLEKILAIQATVRANNDCDYR